MYSSADMSKNYFILYIKLDHVQSSCRVVIVYVSLYKLVEGIKISVWLKLFSFER